MSTTSASTRTDVWAISSLWRHNQSVSKSSWSNDVTHVEELGPCINVSTTWLYFYKCKRATKITNILELRNTSKVDATFQFDVNEGQQDLFVVKPVRGTLPANKYSYVEVQYVPKKPGQHFTRLFCLIEYHVWFGVFLKIIINVKTYTGSADNWSGRYLQLERPNGSFKIEPQALPNAIRKTVWFFWLSKRFFEDTNACSSSFFKRHHLGFR